MNLGIFYLRGTNGISIADVMLSFWEDESVFSFLPPCMKNVFRRFHDRKTSKSMPVM